MRKILLYLMLIPIISFSQVLNTLNYSDVDRYTIGAGYTALHSGAGNGTSAGIQRVVLSYSSGNGNEIDRTYYHFNLTSLSGKIIIAAYINTTINNAYGATNILGIHIINNNKVDSTFANNNYESTDFFDYGKQSLSSSDDGTTIKIPFNSTGLSYLNSKIGTYCQFGLTSEADYANSGYPATNSGEILTGTQLIISTITVPNGESYIYSVSGVGDSSGFVTNFISTGNRQSAWDSCRAGMAVNQTWTNTYLLTDNNGGSGGYDVIDRSFLAFNTQNLPSNSTIDSAVLYLNATGINISDTIFIVGNSANLPFSVNSFTSAGSISFGNKYINSTGSFTLNLNSSGLSSLAKAGISKLAICGSKDFWNNKPSGIDSGMLGFNNPFSTYSYPGLLVYYHISSGGSGTVTSKATHIINMHTP